MTRADVERVLERTRSALSADGGDVRLTELDGNNARVALYGRFVGSPVSVMALRLGMERAIRERVEDFGELIVELAGEGETPAA